MLPRFYFSKILISGTPPSFPLLPHTPPRKRELGRKQRTKEEKRKQSKVKEGKKRAGRMEHTGDRKMEGGQIFFKT